MRKPPIPTTKCEACKDGLVPGRLAGETLRREREERHVTRATLAKHFGFSESYTIDLERGARPLTWDLVTAYRAAIEKAVKERVEVRA